MKFWVFGILFLALLLLVLGIIIPIYRSYHKATGSIINYDSTMRKFIYKMNLSSEDITGLLQVKNGADELSCTFDSVRSVVKFSEYSSSQEYYFGVQKYNGFSILRLEQVTKIGMQSHVPFKLNPFILRKLQAEPVPFSQYSF